MDNLEQLKWMQFKVCLAGYNGIEDAIHRSPKYFNQLAVEWRNIKTAQEQKELAC